MTNTFLRLTLAFLCPLACLAAQGEAKTTAKPQLGPRSFFPREYTKEFFLDVDALQDTTLWDAMERMAGSGTLRMKFRQEYGFRIEEIESVRVTGRYIKEEENSEAGARQATVTVIQGKTVCLPPVRKPQQFASLELAKQKILGYDVVREAATKGFDRGLEAVLYLIPRPGCLVIGSEELIKTIINGKRRGGVIEPRLMALTAIRKPLGYLAVGFPAVDDPRYQEEVGIDPNWLDEDDPLEHVIARLSYDEKTEKISVEATLRFKTGKEGPKLLEESAKGAIEAFKQQKIFPVMKTYFDKIQWRQDGVDLHISVTIHPNEMTGLFGGTGLVMYFLMDAPAVGLAPAPAPVLVAPAVAAERKAGKKKPAAKPTKKGVTEKPTPPKAKKKDG